MQKAENFLITVVGPTAVGKTAVSIKLAQNYQTEVVSADARQCYKELNIGTAKPSREELEAAPHHFINSHSIHQESSAGQFELEALEVIKQLHAKNQYCIMAGGSGLYVQAVCQGFDPMPEVDQEIRERFNLQYAKHGLTPLLEKLRQEDPKYYMQVDRDNPHRVIRALEICTITGRPYSVYRTGNEAERPFGIVMVGLEIDRDKLYHRIDQRVDRMVQSGLFEEAHALFPFKDIYALQTVGYKEIFGFFEGAYDQNEAVRLLKRNTRRYAKRQLTWFRKDRNVTWFDPKEVDQMISFINSRSG